MAASTLEVEQRNLSGATGHYRRRFPRGDDGGSSLRRGIVTTAASAGSLTAPATNGVVQLYKKNSGNTAYEVDGEPVLFWNTYPLAFAIGYVGTWDEAQDPLEIVVATCNPA
jgi:hypothetical protein